MKRLARQVLNAARTKGLRIATAESCTGGMVSAALTDIAGSSDVVECGFVTYSNQAKTAMLGVPGTLLKQHGAVSEPVARAMAEGALARSRADLAIAITGVAGPGASESKPEGMVCFALARRGSTAEAQTLQFGAVGRENVRKASTEQALRWLLAGARGWGEAASD